MNVPSRILYGGRSGAPLGLVAATAASTLMFSATPFLIVPIAERYGVSEGIAGTISVVQVGAFAVANIVLPRLLRPNGRILRASAATLVLLNVASALVGVYAALLVLRLLAGFAAGTMTWLAWTNAMQRSRSMGAIAATGPVTALLAAPMMAALSGWGDRAIYVTMALAAIPAALLITPVAGKRRARGVISRSRSNRVLLASLFFLTFFGSALFINQSIVANEVHGLSALAGSVGFSLNAFGGLVGARLSGRHRYPGWFLASIGVAAMASVIGPVPLFYVGMFWWGFAFWMGIPGVLQMLVDRSLEPAERAGDGQGALALGRSGGPLLGGVFVDAGSITGLTVSTSIGMVLTGLSVVAVKEGRDRLPATDPRTITDDTSP